jgi:hypothetical protein
MPRTVLHEEEFAIITGGVWKNNMEQTFNPATAPILEAPFGRTGGDLFYLAYQFETGWGGGNFRGIASRSLAAQTHVRSEVGAYPRTFQDTPSGTYVEAASTIAAMTGTPAVDTLALCSWLRVEDA